jgi:hypothetical protein
MRLIVWTTVWLILGVAPAEAAPELFVNLKYDVDPTLSGCMGESDFRAMVARQVGYDPYHSKAALGVEVRVRPAEHGIRGGIDWSASAHRQLGERHFSSESQDCNAMLATMGFVLAVQIQLMVRDAVAEPSPGAMDTDHTRASDARRHQPAADTERPSALDARRHQPTADSNRVVEATTSPPTVASEEPPTSRGPPWSCMAGIGPSAGFGLGPDPIAQGRLFISVKDGHAAFELGGEASLPSTTRQDYGGGFRHRLVLGTAAACGLRGSSAACAVVKLGQIGAQGVGLDEPASPRALVAQVGARYAYFVRLGDRLALVGHADALYLLTSWTVDVNHLAVWTMPRLGAVAGIDLAVRFW